MTLFRIVKITVINRQIGDCADQVEIMCLAVASAVKGEFAVINRESAGRPCPAEQTILVVVEITIVEGQIAAFIANSGAVGSATFAPENSKLSIVILPLVMKIALPFGIRPVDTIETIPPTPCRVIFLLIERY